MQQLQPGDILTDLEGYDVGSGAIVMEVSDDQVQLFQLDSQVVDVVTIGPDRAYSVEQDAIDDIVPESYDVLRLDSPELQTNIRTLPNYWGPRDPNMPSTMTDVTWRPEDYGNRWMQRWFANRKAAKQQEKSMKKIQPDWPLPRMHLHQWDEGDEKERDLLRDLAVDFTMKYQRYQGDYLPPRGNRINLRAADYGLIYRRHMGMTDAEMSRLFRFMDRVGWYKGQEALYRDLINSYEVHRRDRIN